MTVDLAWGVYNFINEWKAGNHGECSLEDALNKDFCEKDFINLLPEEPVTGDLKKEIESYCFKHGYISEGVFGYTLQEQVADIAKYFYNLGRQKEEPVCHQDNDNHTVTEDLEEAAIEICSKILKGETVVIDGYEYVVLSDAEECFKAGAKWQKEQDQR